MKAIIATTAAAALAGFANAAGHQNHGRHGHDLFHGLDKKGASEESCGCTTIYSTYTGSPTLSFPPPPPPTTTTTSTKTSTTSTTVTHSSTSTETPPPATTSPPAYTTSPPVVVPTPIPHTCPTTGTYTFPATTITVTDTTTFCGATSTPLPSGTQTYGGVTTVVTTETTVTCPYATVSTSGDVTTSIVATTTYVCPSSGTYTIAPTTTVCPSDTTVTYPTVTSVPPGTYTAPEVVTTVTDTDTIIYCPFDTPTPTPVPTTTYTPAPQPTTTYTPTAQPSTSSAAPSPTSSPGGSLPGKPWAVTFTPYTAEGACMSEADVDKSIAALAGVGVTALRTYSTDCSTLEFVGNACEKYGLKMMVGVYIDTAGCQASSPTIDEQFAAIKSWAKWSITEGVVIGNEAGLSGFCEGSQIASLISRAKSEFSGMTGWYTTADTVNMWQQSDYASPLCGVVDVVGANAHAFFDLGTTADQAGKFVQSQLDIIDSVCPGKSGIILESGWPSKGEAMGLAVPGVQEQITAINSLISTVGDKVCLFSLFNDLWKDDTTPCKCENAFGISSVLGLDLPNY